jgi:hypothetical protein
MKYFEYFLECKMKNTQAFAIALSLFVIFISSSFILAPRSQEEVDESRIIPELINRTSSIQIRDHYAFAAATAGLIVYDVVDPYDVKIVGKTYISGSSVSITLKGNNAYLSAGSSGLWIIDISNPAEPEKVGYYDTQGAAMACARKGNLCYVADGTFGLLVLDISDLKNISKVLAHDSKDVKDYYRDVLIDRDFLYAAVGFNGVNIFKIDGKNIDLISNVDTPGEARTLALSDKILYVADGDGGMKSYDISSPDTPKELSSITTKDFTRGVAVKGEYAYLADGNAGLRIIKVSTSYAPAEKGSARTPSSANRVAVSGKYAYVAADASGLAIYDISKPSSPTRVETKKEKK